MTTNTLRLPIPAAPTGILASVRTRAASLGLGAIVLGSFLIRGFASLGHATPQYFPDEYIYSSLARSIAEHGTLQIRGTAAHFPALFEPLLAAPLWLVARDPTTAYRLTLWMHALAMSLAAVPVYLVARRLGQRPWFALGAATAAVAGPSLVFSSYVTADAVAYPLVLGAVAAIVAALDTPTRRLQVAVVVLSGLSVFTRVQYVVLPVVFAAAALVVERGSVGTVVRRYRLALGLFATPLAAVLALGPTHALGYYRSVLHLHLAPFDLAHWAGLDVMLLALAAGVVLVPGALVGIAAGLFRRRSRAEAAFAATAMGLATLLLFEAALYATNGSGRFQERYLITLAPLAAPAFALVLERGRTSRVAMTIVAAVIALFVARDPLAGYTYGSGSQDSPFLDSVHRIEALAGSYGSGSLLVAGLVTILAAAAVLVAWRPRRGTAAALALSVAVLGVCAYYSTLDDHTSSQSARRTFLPSDPAWLDASGLGHIAFLAPQGTSRGVMAEYLFWNRSLTRIMLLPGAPAPDVFGIDLTAIGKDGSIHANGKVVRSPLVVGEYLGRATLTGAKLVRRTLLSSLWRPTGTPRLSSLTVGRYFDGWFAGGSHVTVWPDRSGWTRGTLRLRFTVPRAAPRVTVRIATPTGPRIVHVPSGGTARVALKVSFRGIWTARMRATPLAFLSDGRAVGVKGAAPVFERAALLKSRTARADEAVR